LLSTLVQGRSEHRSGYRAFSDADSASCAFSSFEALSVSSPLQRGSLSLLGFFNLKLNKAIRISQTFPPLSYDIRRRLMSFKSWFGFDVGRPVNLTGRSVLIAGFES
jgi:hypothetical protein